MVSKRKDLSPSRSFFVAWGIIDSMVRDSVYHIRPLDKAGGLKGYSRYEWEDKAGGYAIQGTFAKYVKGIKGDYYNVVGLPISRLYQELKRLNIEI